MNDLMLHRSPTHTPDLCAACGHSLAMHMIERLTGDHLTPFHGRCTATMDTRAPSVGGDNLTPCRCDKWLAGVPGELLTSAPLIE